MTKTNRAPPGIPPLSIGMPVYNGERWIGATLDCLREQTFTDFELIISDNASTDSTGDICERFAANDPRVRYIRQPRNIGANRNYVAVLDLARAPCFKWASCNDLCAPNFLAACMALLDSDAGAVLAYPRAKIFVDEASDATPYEHDFPVLDTDAVRRFVQVLQKTQLNNAFNGVMRTSLLRKALPMGTFWGADDVLMAELALLGRFLLVGEPLFLRRMSASSATRLRQPRDVELHFEPDAKRPLKWQSWKYHLRLLHSAARSAPAGLQWFGAVRHTLRTMRWARADLAQDVLRATRN